MRRRPDMENSSFGNTRKTEEIFVPRTMSSSSSLSSRIIVIGMILVLSKLTSSSMVLPRPPSSPNHIHQTGKFEDPKVYNQKALQSQKTDHLENPDQVNGYGLLEIELHGADMDAANLKKLLRVLLKNERIANYSYNPTKVEQYHQRIADKDALFGPLQRLDDKLYYLKNGRPKVRANFGTNDRRLPPREDYLQLARSFDKRYYPTKGYRPKKFYPNVDNSATTDRTDNFLQAAKRGYEMREDMSRTRSYKDDEDDTSTTEHSTVTSSELPKQIPAPPSRFPGGQILVAQTTPVQKYVFHRTDILPGYGFNEN